jgi:transcription-repair coupling factor (superfamily II helicase)
MILPFVRDVLADLENSLPFERVRRHLSGGTGRRRVSGLTFTARALYIPFFVRAANAPCLILVADNKAAEALHAAIVATCELTDAIAADSLLCLPAHDVLPFENLSPHPEILEARAATLWKIASGTARLVIAPVEAACMRLFPHEHYASLALRLKCGDEVLTEMLMEHLLSVGYTRVDVVDMPGQVTLRGGILDAYSPELDRPVRIEFFGDEIESIRRFDPETQRSASTMDEALLLPLTETPVTNKILTAINARLTRSGTADGAKLEGGEEPVELQTHLSNHSGEATVFPGWEFFAPVARTAAHANLSLLDLLGPTTRVFLDEPAMVKNQAERWWNKVEQRHERSGIGTLIRPEDIYISPWDLDDRLRRFSGCELDQLGSVDVLDADRSDLSGIDFSTRPTQRFHGNIPALIEAIHALLQQEARVLIAAANQGEVERLAGLLQEYQVPYRLGSRIQAPGSSTVYSESSYLAGDLRTPVLVRTAIANGVQVLDLRDADGRSTARQIVLFGVNDLADDADVQARPVARTKSRTSAFVSDFRDLAVGDYVVHVEHGIAQYCGLRVIEEPSQPPLELMILEFADEAKL